MAIERSIPSVTDLMSLDAPELAVLCALETTARAAINAVLAANPELQGDGPFENCDRQLPQVWIADAIYTHASALLVAIGRYRHAVYVADSRAAIMAHDWPF